MRGVASTHGNGNIVGSHIYRKSIILGDSMSPSFIIKFVHRFDFVIQFFCLFVCWHEEILKNCSVATMFPASLLVFKKLSQKRTQIWGEGRMKK